jgi:putative Ca2+/H+ antiporter (TMEM165/GDT1 family)
MSTLIGVFAGRLVTEFVGEQALRYVAGVAFVAIGLWTLLRP